MSDPDLIRLRLITNSYESADIYQRCHLYRQHGEEVFTALHSLLDAAQRVAAVEKLFAGMADPQREITALKDRLAVANEMVELWKSWAKQAMIRHPDLRNDVAQVAP